MALFGSYRYNKCKRNYDESYERIDVSFNDVNSSVSSLSSFTSNSDSSLSSFTSDHGSQKINASLVETSERNTIRTEKSKPHNTLLVNTDNEQQYTPTAHSDSSLQTENLVKTPPHCEVHVYKNVPLHETAECLSNGKSLDLVNVVVNSKSARSVIRGGGSSS